MTKRNNKGFSIVDSIIAVAVLTILITPILYQVIHTMNTSRQAKERQYVLDNAQYVMTFFQSTKDEGLYKVDPVDPTLAVVEDDLSSSDSKIDVLQRASQEVPCNLHLLKKNASNVFVAEVVDDHDLDLNDPDHDTATLKYGVDCYLLSAVPLGKNGNTYERTVVVDDLSSKIINIKDADGSIKYDIAYDVDSESNEYGLDSSDVQRFIDDGWTLTNEGSLVKYLDITIGSEVYSVIQDAIVVEHGKYYREDDTIIDTRYSDPNSMEMSFMQNLDADKVALIQGNAASFDRQAEKDFFNVKMNYLKVENPEQYNQILTTKTGETGFNGTDSAKKATRISIKKTTDFSGKECYQVDCDVFYYDSFSLTPGINHSETLNYNVYSKKFYTTNKSPDIYFIYEPFVTNSSDTEPDFRYAATDTIVVYNDAESRNSKLYVIKPEWDQLSVKYDRNDLNNTAVDPETGKPVYDETTKYQAPRDDVFWTKNYRGRLIPVEIEFGWIAAPYDGGEAGTNTPLRVFTNLKTEKKYPNATDRDDALTDDQKYVDVRNGGNLRPYTSNVIESLYTAGADIYVTDTHGSAGSVRIYNGDDTLDNDPSNDIGDSKKDYIRSVIDDVVSKDRLNTVTVTFRKVGSGDDETPIARYSGAKEVN